ncbi:MAG: hypothetical protein OEY29_11125 [Gammaproteobacteria bacterium]|nr:hypothetical protein [Gammaproteobacteria bacterium]
MSDKYSKIATVLCEITDQLVIDPAVNFNNRSLDDINFSSRMGSGHATYCKHDVRNNTYSITYGKKMIQSKLDENKIVNWLTWREISRYNYFSGDTSIASVLAHTICHEFSHLLQQYNKWHIKGSVHNKKFYHILNHLHQTGVAQNIKDQLLEQCDNLSVALEFETLKSEKPLVIEKQFSINDEICFSHKNKTYNGRVIKVNKKTLIVSVASFLRKTEWKVPKPLALNNTQG